MSHDVTKLHFSASARDDRKGPVASSIVTAVENEYTHTHTQVYRISLIKSFYMKIHMRKGGGGVRLAIEMRLTFEIFVESTVRHVTAYTVIVYTGTQESCSGVSSSSLGKFLRNDGDQNWGM